MYPSPYGVPAQAVMSPGEAGIPSVPFEMPRDVFRYGENVLYSSYLFLTTTALANGVFRIFSTSLGNAGAGFTNALTVTETNLKEPGRVPNAQAFDVFAVAGQVIQTDATTADGTGMLDAQLTALANIADIANFVNGCVLAWNFTQTTIYIAPLSLVGAGGGLYGDVVAGTAAAPGANFQIGVANNGNGSLWVYRRHPVQLPGGTTFAVQAEFGSRAATLAANALILRIVLCGYYKNVTELG